jgi:hypothetical protein
MIRVLSMKPIEGNRNEGTLTEAGKQVDKTKPFLPKWQSKIQSGWSGDEKESPPVTE